MDCVPTALDTKIPSLLEAELAKFPVSVQPSPAVSGQGVFTAQTIPDGDLIMDATCLLFTDPWLLQIPHTVAHTAIDEFRCHVRMFC